MRWPAAIACALGLACATAPPTAPPSELAPPCPENVVIPVGAGQGVILTGVTAWVGGPGKVTGSWTPTTAEVLRAEDGLAKFLAGAAPALAVKYSTFVRQYTGFVVDAHRKIHMNFLCWKPETPGWRCSQVAVLDGGDCYFQVDYDMTSGEYENLQVNGMA
ncbi:MAG TPA: hypothetical protein VGS03_09665 [Candidatus Polarisedimenticolia bacterium]|jgi:hypothetical protein|nr:hypothetical protein [Candidatus Polarisedimenticolia bacterium]